MPRALLFLVLVTAVLAAWFVHGALAREDRASAPASVTLRELVLPDGGTIRVPVRAERVLPANASALDVVARLVGRERIVAIPRMGFEYSSLAEDPEPWRGVPTIGTFESEGILALAPDLVLTHANQDRATVGHLRGSGVCVFDVPVITDWDGLLSTLRLVGAVLGEDAAAEELVRELAERRAAIDAGPARGCSVLAYGNYGGTGFTAGRGTTGDLMIELAGMRNAAAEAGLVNNVGIDFEQILVMDPDVIVVGADGRSAHSPSAAILHSESSLEGLRALEEGRVVVLPDDLYSTASQRIVAAAEELARRAAAAWEAR